MDSQGQWAGEKGAGKEKIVQCETVLNSSVSGKGFSVEGPSRVEEWIETKTYRFPFTFTGVLPPPVDGDGQGRDVPESPS